MLKYRRLRSLWRRKWVRWVGSVGFVAALGVGYIILLEQACTVSEDRARRALEDAGYELIEHRGHAWFTCSKDDELTARVQARNPKGDEVTVAVCCGAISKGCTIRH